MKDTTYKSVFTAIDISFVIVNHEKAIKKLNDDNTGPRSLLETLRLIEIVVCTVLVVHNQLFQQKV